MSDHHVAPHPDGGWQLTQAERPQDVRVYTTQQEAVEQARREMTRSGGGELVIHGNDGRVREKRTVTPGSDPYPPPG